MESGVATLAGDASFPWAVGVAPIRIGVAAVSGAVRAWVARSAAFWLSASARLPRARVLVSLVQWALGPTELLGKAGLVVP